jgi:adenylylsulfate kinase
LEIAGLTKHFKLLVAEKLHIIPHQHTVSNEDRECQNGHKGHVLWFTGLSGSGKSTVASVVERELHQRGIRTYILDGDNVRTGLNSDLDFSAASREENIRRIAHVSALMKDAGLVVLSAFVSPYQKDRDFVRACSNGDFSELFISTPLEVCEQRDVKGLYAKARAGEISNFTGISAPFEAPGNPELDVPTHTMSIEEAAAMVVAYIIPKITGDNE